MNFRIIFSRKLVWRLAILLWKSFLSFFMFYPLFPPWDDISVYLPCHHGLSNHFCWYFLMDCCRCCCSCFNLQNLMFFFIWDTQFPDCLLIHYVLQFGSLDLRFQSQMIPSYRAVFPWNLEVLNSELLHCTRGNLTFHLQVAACIWNGPFNWSSLRSPRTHWVVQN